MKTIGIIGAGAMGILYGQKLTDAYGKDRVFFAADSERVRGYKEKGVVCNGESCDFKYVTEMDEEQADLLIFAVKFTGLKAAIKQAAHLVGPNTAVISVLNGITSEESLAEAYGSEHIIHCVAQGMDAVKEGNEVTYKNLGVLILGVDCEEKRKLLDQAAALLVGGGIACQPVEDIKYRLWSKLMLNVGINQVAAVFATNYGGMQQEGEARMMMVAAMREVMILAEKEGITLTEADIENWISLVDSLNPEGMPSMRQDTKAGRTTEVELFSGTIMGLGKKHGISTPVNDFLYEKIRELERNQAR